MMQRQPAQEHNHMNINNVERWASAIGGGVLVSYALTGRKYSPVAFLLGAALMYRGIQGHSHLYQALGVSTAQPGQNELKVKKTVTINRSPADAYRFWRQLENLPQFMSHVKAVEVGNNGLSHWTVNTPTGINLQWDAEIIADRPDELIAWKTLPDSFVQHAGLVRFRPSRNDRGTEMEVILEYFPPGGVIGEAFAQLLNVVTAQQIKEEIRRCKSILEAGEVPTIEGQPTGP